MPVTGEESDWSRPHTQEIQLGFSGGWIPLQLSFTAGLRRMLRWLWGHLVAYLPGFPEGLVLLWAPTPHWAKDGWVPSAWDTAWLGSFSSLSCQHSLGRVLWNILSLSPPQAVEKELPRAVRTCLPAPASGTAISSHGKQA